MRGINSELFNILKNRAANIVMCWVILRQDGQVFGFTQHDQQFMLPDPTPANTQFGVSAEASTATFGVGALTDANSNNWYVGSLVTAPATYKIMKNGIQAYGTTTGSLLQIDLHGVVWMQDALGVWWKDKNSSFEQMPIGPEPAQVIFYPINGMFAEATVSKNDFSSNNATSKIIFGGEIEEQDVRTGLFDYAIIQSFWCDPTNLNLGTVPIQKGHMGEVTLINGSWTAEFRSLLDLLQLPFGRQYNLECDAHLGDTRCGVPLPAPVWQPSTTYVSQVPGDARIGGAVQPTVSNGWWYQCVGGTTSTVLTFPEGVSFGGLGADPFVGTGINPFNGWGQTYGPAFAAAFEAAVANQELFNTTPGTPYVAQVTVYGGASGNTEPSWPTNNTIFWDGNVQWQGFPAYIQTGSCTGQISRTQFEDVNRTEEATWYQYGTLQWLTGENAGKITEVRQQTATQSGLPCVITLLEVMPNPIGLGDTYRIMVGCNHVRTECQSKFNNVLNHRGYPDMPTEDRILTTPDFSTSQPVNFTAPSGGGKKG
jgi:hypothetical protein